MESPPHKIDVLHPHPELIKLRLLAVVRALILASTTELIPSANVYCATAGCLVLGLHTNKASINLLLRVRVDPLDLQSTPVRSDLRETNTMASQR